MKINQDALPFRQITIILNKQSEAKAFFDMVDMIDRFVSNAGEELGYDDFTKDQKDLIIMLSNAKTNGEVKV